MTEKIDNKHLFIHLGACPHGFKHAGGFHQKAHPPALSPAGHWAVHLNSARASRFLYRLLRGLVVFAPSLLTSTKTLVFPFASYRSHPWRLLACD